MSLLFLWHAIIQSKSKSSEFHLQCICKNLPLLSTSNIALATLFFPLEYIIASQLVFLFYSCLSATPLAKVYSLFREVRETLLNYKIRFHDSIYFYLLKQIKKNKFLTLLKINLMYLLCSCYFLSHHLLSIFLMSTGLQLHWPPFYWL